MRLGKPKRKKPAPTLAKLKKRAWALLSEVVRREAADELGGVACFTCGTVHDWRDIQAGHAIGGRNGAVLFDEELIRPQDVRCNIMLRGNYGEFIPRLLREYTIKHQWSVSLDTAMNWWEQKLLSAKQIKKWTRTELEEKCQEYRERLARL
jgi:NinG protein